VNARPAILTKFAFWSLVAATSAAIAWRWSGNELPEYASAVLGTLGVAYGILIIAMNQREERPRSRETSAAE